ncbi:hypothetical protein EJ03DRAFT_351824 [Teratosphaeria nubilosa]|uniref:Uncharacterized protein n=1 Tax=Teratosphaeria nubilosa TaxID=161662 RepID=A0A6G1L799_9PEZI|nr:hypothetical protein EJ03DRAFT_351824 [Teratosphaeria nubilosa]
MAPTTRYQLRLKGLEASGQGHALTAARSSGIRKNRSGKKKKTQGKGTKPQALEVNKGKLEPSSRAREIPYRVADDLWIPYRETPSVNILQLSRVFVGDADNSNARALCFELAHRVEELGLLKGYSSTAIAGAVVHFAASSLGKDTSIKPDKRRRNSGLRKEVKAEEPVDDDDGEMED